MGVVVVDCTGTRGRRRWVGLLMLLLLLMLLMDAVDAVDAAAAAAAAAAAVQFASGHGSMSHAW